MAPADIVLDLDRNLPLNIFLLYHERQRAARISHVPLPIAPCAATLQLRQVRVQYGRMGAVFDVGPVA